MGFDIAYADVIDSTREGDPGIPGRMWGIFGRNCAPAVGRIAKHIFNSPTFAWGLLSLVKAGDSCISSWSNLALNIATIYVFQQTYLLIQ